jgi:vacuolar-type H+-ATPase subunit I/STV1
MTYPGSTDVPGQVLWAGTTQGPKAVPGTYKVVLQLGNVKQEHTFDIRKDPRIASAVADMQAQFDMHTRLNTMLTTVHDDVLRVRELRTEIAQAKTRLRDADSVLRKQVDSLAKQALDTLQSIEDECIQHRIKAFQDALNYPVKLNNKIAALIGVIASADTRPTQQAVDFEKELQRRTDVQHARLARVESEAVAAINTAIATAGAPVILPRKQK